MNKVVFISAVVAFLQVLSLMADESAEIEEVRRSLSNQDVVDCCRSLTPVVEKLARGGYFSNGKYRDEIVHEILFNALDRRVSIKDDQWRKRFSGIEFMMRQSSVLQVPTYDASMVPKIQKYFCNVKVMDVGGLKPAIETARKKDEALIAAGAIERPLIIIGNSTTPNLRTAREELDKVRNWNSLVSSHRLRVGRLLSAVIKKNLDVLPEDLRMQKCRELVNEAGLSQAEIDVIIADPKIRKQLKPCEKASASTLKGPK